MGNSTITTRTKTRDEQETYAIQLTRITLFAVSTSSNENEIVGIYM
jgi:hypothetical protein